MTLSRKNLVAVFCGAALAAGPAMAQQTRNCADEIARLKKLIQQAEAGGAPVEDMKEGNFATMHRQPTPATVLAADQDAMKRAKAALAQAQAAHAKGKDAACLDALDLVAF